MWVIYLLECFDKSIYTGITNNLQKRIEAHNNQKGAKYTKYRIPVKLIIFFTVETKSEALKIEHYIKSLPKKEKLTFTLEEYYAKTI